MQKRVNMYLWFAETYTFFSGDCTAFTLLFIYAFLVESNHCIICLLQFYYSQHLSPAERHSHGCLSADKWVFSHLAWMRKEPAGQLLLQNPNYIIISVILRRSLSGCRMLIVYCLPAFKAQCVFECLSNSSSVRSVVRQWRCCYQDAEEDTVICLLLSYLHTFTEQFVYALVWSLCW